MNPFAQPIDYLVQMKPLKKWILIGFLTFQIMFIAACLLGITRANTLINRLQHMNNDQIPPAFRLMDSAQLMSQINLLLANYQSLEGELRKKNKDFEQQCENEIATNMQVVSRYLHTQPELKAYQIWDQIFKNYLKARPVYMNLLDRGKTNEAKTYYVSVLAPLTDEITKELKTIIQFHKDQGFQRMQKDLKIGQASRDLLIIFLCFGLFLGAFLLISVFRIVEHYMNQLELKQKRLDIALDIGRMGTWTIDIKKSTIYLSTSLRNLFRVAPEEETISIERLIQHTHPDDRPLLLKHLTHPTERFALEFKILKDDGELHWVTASGITVKDGNCDIHPQIIGVVADITEIRKAINELDRFFLISSDLLAIATPAGYLKRVNSAFVEIFGYSIAEFEGRSILQLIRESDHQEILNTLETFQEGQVIHLENRCQHKDGNERIINWTLVKSPEDSLVYITARDVTQDREKEQVLLQSAKMLSLGEMSAGIAHEVNNPLAIIKTKAQQIKKALAREHYELLPTYSEEIETTVERIVKIVNGLRSFSRDGHNDPLEKVSIYSIIEETIGLCRSRFLSHSVTLESSGVPSDLILECRPVQISQVLLNLLNNAFDAVGALEEKWVKLEARDEGSHIELSVTDSGNGISKELINKLFRPFFTTKAIGVGTGLGLSISSNIIKSHQGTLTVDTRCKNTRFLIRIPKVQLKEQKTQGGSA